MAGPNAAKRPSSWGGSKAVGRSDRSMPQCPVAYNDRCQSAALSRGDAVSDSSRRQTDFEKLLTTFNAALPLLLTAQSPKGARGNNWSMRIVRWQEGANNVRGIEVRCAPWLFTQFGEHLESRGDVVFYRSHPSGGKPTFSLRRRKALFVRPPY